MHLQMEQLRLRSDKPKHNSGNKHTNLIADALQDTTVFSPAVRRDSPDKKAADQSEICGLLSVVRVFADKNGQSSVRHPDGSSADTNANVPAEGRFRSKQAW